MPHIPNNLKTFEAIRQIVKTLRGPDGCPWDKEQTHKSLTRFAIEETYELVDAIEFGQEKNVVEELGDVLFQVLLHSEIAEAEGRFSIDDVIEALSKKMISRHPHVFSDTKVNNSQDVDDNWNKIKAQEKKSKPQRAIEVPIEMPALMRAQKIGEKTRKLRFDWQNPTEVLMKVEEEFVEVKQAMAEESPEEQRGEVGDLLFSVVQLARHLKIDAEQALRECNERFLGRYDKMLEIAKSRNLKFDSLQPEDMENLWREAKKRG